MSLIKNAPGQFLYGTLIDKNSGDPITSGATLDLAKDGAPEAPAEAILTHKGKGLWEAALSASDTDAEILGYVWSGPNIVNQGGTIVTVEYSRQTVSAIYDALLLLLDWANQVPTADLDSPCAQNPARTRGPTTEPLFIPTPYSRTRPLVLETNNNQLER